MSSNPFRRSRPVEPDASSANIFTTRPTATQAPAEDAVSTTPPRRIKKTKRVQIQTPPHSPALEYGGRRLSASDSATRAPSPPPEHDGEASESESESESDSTTTGDEDLKQATINTRRNSGSLPPPNMAAMRAPYNPFARTLATSGAGLGPHEQEQEQESQPQLEPEQGAMVGKEQRKPAIDVDMFKNILMTGSAGPAGLQNGRPLHDSGSSTDTSSIFDPAYGLHPESPRLSYDDNRSASEEEDDNESSGLMGAEGRLDDLAPPAPPKPKRGPQTVSFAHFDQSIPPGFQSGPRTPPVHTQHLTGILRTATPPRSNSDLNKPLPPPPQASSEPPTVPDKDTPPPLPQHEDATPKKVPPPPPTARRQPGVHTRDRSVSNVSNQDSITSEPSSLPPRIEEPISKPAPPPPPSRKPHLVQSASKDAPPSQSTEGKLIPAPPPRRNPSKSRGNANLSRRTSSDDSTTKTPAPAPPPPPPRRERGPKRTSMDGPPASLPHRFSGDNYRAASFDSERSASISSLQKVSESEPTAVPPTERERDILADMAAFQAEIDALRKGDGKR